MADDRQAEAHAAVATARTGVALAETLEHVRQEIRLDAGPRVGDRDFHLRARPPQAELDGAAFGRELDRIREQVPDDLLQPIGSPRG